MNALIGLQAFANNSCVKNRSYQNSINVPEITNKNTDKSVFLHYFYSYSEKISIIYVPFIGVQNEREADKTFFLCIKVMDFSSNFAFLNFITKFIFITIHSRSDIKAH